MQKTSPQKTSISERPNRKEGHGVKTKNIILRTKKRFKTK